MALWRVSTNTGRCLSGGAKLKSRISPRAMAPATQPLSPNPRPQPGHRGASNSRVETRFRCSRSALRISSERFSRARLAALSVALSSSESSTTWMVSILWMLLHNLFHSQYAQAAPVTATQNGLPLTPASAPRLRARAEGARRSPSSYPRRPPNRTPLRWWFQNRCRKGRACPLTSNRAGR
jgi:hypothetical protein